MPSHSWRDGESFGKPGVLSEPCDGFLSMEVDLARALDSVIKLGHIGLVDRDRIDPTQKGLFGYGARAVSRKSYKFRPPAKFFPLCMK